MMSAPHQRLAAGDPQLAYAPIDEGRAKAVELFQGQHVPLRQKIHVFRHAIDAAHVAAIRHRNADIGDHAPKRIDERRRTGGPGWRGRLA